MHNTFQKDFTMFYVQNAIELSCFSLVRISGRIAADFLEEI